MRNRRLLVFAVIMLLLPVQAFAAVCFRSQAQNGFAGISGDVNDLRVVLVNPSPSEGFFSLVGEARRSSCDPSENAPLTGAAHIRLSDGAAHFSVFIGGTAHCLPVVIEGIVHPSTYNSGTGNIDVPSTNQSDAVFLFPLDCSTQPPPH